MLGQSDFWLLVLEFVFLSVKLRWSRLSHTSICVRKQVQVVTKDLSIGVDIPASCCFLLPADLSELGGLSRTRNKTDVGTSLDKAMFSSFSSWNSGSTDHRTSKMLFMYSTSSCWAAELNCEYLTLLNSALWTSYFTSLNCCCPFIFTQQGCPPHWLLLR